MITCETHDDTLHVLLGTGSIQPLSRRWQQAFASLIEQLERLPDTIHAIQIRFDRDSVLADYDLPQLMTLTAAQAPDCMAMLASHQQLLRRLETLGKPVIAILEGELQGHALGLALACPRRYALAGTRYSLPQLALGIMPCNGEVARLGRLAGYQAAMPLLLEGHAVDNQQALQLGLIHGSAADATELATLVEHDLADGQRRQQPWDTLSFRLPGGAPDSAANLRLLQIAPAMLRARTGGHAPAAEALLCALAEGLQVDFANALLIERRYFCQTILHPAAKQIMRLSQHSCNLTSPQAQHLHEDLNNCYAQSCQRLLDEGVGGAVLMNAARAAGLPAPPIPAALLEQARPGTHPQPADAVAQRLLQALAVTAQRHVEGAELDRQDADQISVKLFGFPAHLGGAASFVLSKQE